MSGGVFLAVLGAALLHAAWNALVKSGSDKLLSVAAIVLGHMPMAIVALGFVPPPARESLPYLAGGILLHFGYQLFLVRAYQAGDLTQVYPIARGSAPLMVALFSVVVLGVSLTGAEILAIAVIGAGILSLALVRHSDQQHNRSAAALALGTGLFIAAYSLVDGLGARLSGSAIAFYSWLTLGNAVLMIVYLAATAPATLRAVPRAGLSVVVLGGSASFVAYALVIWAFTQAPIALVTALRETSIIFALMIGVVVLKEPLSVKKLMSTLTTLLGVILLRFVKS